MDNDGSSDSLAHSTASGPSCSLSWYQPNTAGSGSKSLTAAMMLSLETGGLALCAGRS